MVGAVPQGTRRAGQQRDDVGADRVETDVSEVEEAGLAAVRAKSVALTEFVIEVADELLVPRGVEIISPRAAQWRGGHVTLSHPSFRELMPVLWERGVIPDFRPPQGLRIGLSPMSTSFGEVTEGLRMVADLL